MQHASESFALLCCVAGVSHKDAHKLQYAVDAAAWMEDPFTSKGTLENPVFEALLWQAGKSPKEIIQHREEMVAQIELASEEIGASGVCRMACMVSSTVWSMLL